MNFNNETSARDIQLTTTISTDLELKTKRSNGVAWYDNRNMLLTVLKVKIAIYKTMCF